MSIYDVFACVWVLSVAASFTFNLIMFIVTNNSTAGRPPSREQIEEAVRKYKAQVEADIAAYTRVLRTSAHTVLGISPTATQEEIKAAYRRLAMKHHPDRGGSQDEFQKIKVAYEQLMKPKRCPQCEGKGTIRVKRGAFIDTIQCPRCWPTKDGEK